MSLLRIVTGMVRERGRATVDDLMPELAEDGYTRAQVLKAMHNAKHLGLIDCDGRMPRKGGPRNGSRPSPYYPAQDVCRGRRPINSVFELARA